MPLLFLDTNVLLRHVRQDHPIHSPRATAILARIERGELRARISDIVVFETVFSLQRGYRQPRDLIAAALLDLLKLPGIVLPGKRIYDDVFGLYLSTSLGFADCYHVALIRRNRGTDIFTFDEGFDRIPGLVRREE
jgi:predicted nucleic acid-binding protein